jgi:hypothetical protein
MFDECHFVYNCEASMSHDVSKSEKWMSTDIYIFLMKCHLYVTCLVVCFISISNVSIHVWFFASQVTGHVKFLNNACQLTCFFTTSFLSVKCLGLWSGRDVAFGRPVTSQMTWRHHVASRPRTMPKGRYDGSNFIYPMVFFLQRHRKVDCYDHCYYASWLLLGAFVPPIDSLLE